MQTVLLLSLLACFGRTGTDADTDTDPASDDTASTGDDTDPTGSSELALTFGGDAPKNIILIGIDTLRRDYVGYYGGSDAAPFLSEKLAEGFALDNHRSCSNSTYPSLLGVLTGANNLDIDFVPTSGINPPERTPDTVLTAVDAMNEQGYTTVFAGATAFMSDQYNLATRYDLTTNAADWNGEVVVEQALGFADDLEGAEEPWFLHVHYFDPHFPYTHPPEYNGAIEDLEPIAWDLTSAQGVEAFAGWEDKTPEEQALLLAHVDAYYKAAIEYTDDQIQALWEGLDERGLLDDALVIFWSDHGEQFYEHGGFTHGVDIYGEETWAIGGFWADGLTQAAWDSETSHIDLMPSAFAALGLEPGAQFTGKAVGNDPSHRFTFRGKSGETWHGVDLDGKRLVYQWTGTIEYYDIESDPGELTDLYDPDDATVQALWSQLEPRVQKAAELIDETDPEGSVVEPVWP